MIRSARRFSPVVVLTGLLVAVTAPFSVAQSIVFGNHREVAIPDYATVRIGPFYSTVAFALSVGYRYVDTYGSGTDFMRRNERGEILKDGSDLPIIASLDFRNYLLITRRMDLDASVRLAYAYYPFRTQDDLFSVDLAEEGVLGTLSSEFRITPYVQGNVHDTVEYRTDFVDTRGFEDQYGGQRYTYLRNRVGSDITWLMAENKKATAGISRTDNIPYSDGFDLNEYILYDESIGYFQTVLPGLGLGATAHFWQYDYRTGERQDASFQDVRLVLSFGRDTQKGIRVGRATTVDFSLGVASAVRGSAVSDPGGSNEVVLASDDVLSVVGGVELTTQLRADLRHVLAFQHGTRGGFNGAYESYDSATYRLDWNRQIYSAYLLGSYMSADPMVAGDGPYRNWHAAVGGKYPLQRTVFLTGEAGYYYRDNTPDPATGGDLESRADYATAYARIGTEFELTRETRFRAYAEHLERLSSEEDLAFGRDMAGIDIVYRHQF